MLNNTVPSNSEKAINSTDRFVNVRIGVDGKVRRYTMAEYLHKVNTTSVTTGSLRWRQHMQTLVLIASDKVTTEFWLTLTPIDKTDAEPLPVYDAQKALHDATEAFHDGEPLDSLSTVPVSAPQASEATQTPHPVYRDAQGNLTQYEPIDAVLAGLL